MQKYGTDTFNIELIEEHTDITVVRQREKELIETYKTRAPQGYNIHVGGLGGDNISKHPDNIEIRQRLSESHLKSQKRGSEHPRYVKYNTRILQRAVELYFSFELPSPIQIINDCKLSGKDVFNRIIKEQGSKLWRSKIERFEQNPENLIKLHKKYFIERKTVAEIMNTTSLSASSITYLLRKHFSSELPSLKKLHQRHK